MPSSDSYLAQAFPTAAARQISQAPEKTRVTAPRREGLANCLYMQLAVYRCQARAGICGLAHLCASVYNFWVHKLVLYLVILDARN